MLQLAIVRSLLRELLMICVLRPCIMLCWPGTIYRVSACVCVRVHVRVCVLRMQQYMYSTEAYDMFASWLA